MLLLIYKKELQYGAEIVTLAKPFFELVEQLTPTTMTVLGELNGYEAMIETFKTQLNELSD